MGIIITKQSDIDAYFDSDDCSQSTLKLLLKGFKEVVEKRQEVDSGPTPAHFIIGSGTDCILTGEEGEFEKQYYISSLEKKPSDAEMQIIDAVHADAMDSYTEEQFNEQGLERLGAYRGSIIAAIDEFGWQMRWKEETRINKIEEVGSAYFEDLKKAYGKQITSQQQYNVITDIVMSLRTHPKTAKYFDREIQGRNTHVDFYYQLPIYFTQEGTVPCKALLDLVIVVKDDAGQIISVQGIDLKTMSGATSEFLFSVRTRRYDIQAAWYTKALQYWVVATFNTTCDIKPFTFVVESSTEIGNPLVYKVSPDLLDIGINGRVPITAEITKTLTEDGVENAIEIVSEVILAKEIRGFISLMKDYIWYEDTDWQTDRKIVEKEKNGVLELDWNSII